MDAVTVPAALHHRIGFDASEGLVDMFAAHQQFSTDRFERRLAEEIGAVRVEIAGVHAAIARTQGELMKWTLLLWVGQFAALAGVWSFLLLHGR